MLLTPHFTLAELNGDAPGVSPFARRNLQRTAEALERARAIIGRPLIVTSGWRSREQNADAGGSSTSSHVEGLAADFYAQGANAAATWAALRSGVDRLGDFDQLIFYPDTGHVHLGIGPRNRRELLVKTASGFTRVDARPTTIAAADATRTPGTPQQVNVPVPDGIAGVIVLAALVVLSWILTHTTK